MLKQSIFTLALATLAIPSAIANPLKDYIYSHPVLAVLHESGTKIKFKGGSCDKDVYGSYHMKTDIMHICISKHEDFEELGDTIRHEAIHVIQACNSGPVLGLYETVSYAKDEDQSVIEEYPTAHQHMELEARIAARNLSDANVTELIRKFCF
jgi:hypothetical protein